MISIRTLEPHDAAQLGSFFTENDRPEVRRHFNPFPLNEETARSICRNDQNDRYFVAVLAGRVIGFSMLRGWGEGFAVPSFGILIDRLETGRGLGRRMTEFTVAEAKNLACERVRLSVYASNTRAVALYLSLGFVELERQPVDVAGEPDVKIIMMKSLTA